MCPDSGGVHLKNSRLQRFQWAGPPRVRRGRCRCQAKRRCPPRAQTGTLVPMSASLWSNRCKPHTGRVRSGCIRLHSRRSGRHGAGSPSADILWRRSYCRHPQQREQHPTPDGHNHQPGRRAALEFLPCLFHFFSTRLTAQAVKTFWRSAPPLESIQSSKGTPLIASSRLASSREGRLFSQKILARVAGLTPSHSATWYCRIVFMTLFIFYLKTFSKEKARAKKNKKKEHADRKNRRAREHKKSPTAPTVGLRGRALTAQGKENKEIKIYSTCPELSNIV